MLSATLFEDFTNLPEGSFEGYVEKRNDLLNCLYPMLKSLGWSGEIRSIAEAFPHLLESVNIATFQNVFKELSYESHSFKANLEEIDERLLPCLFVPEEGSALVVLAKEDGVLVYDGGKESISKISLTGSKKGTVYLFNHIEHEEVQARKQDSTWFSKVLGQFKGLFVQILATTFLISFISLGTPLFIMATYNRVIATESISMLSSFLLGLGIALLGMVVLTIVRTQALAYMSGRIDNLVGDSIFGKIILLPLPYTENTTVGAQISRLKDLDSVREFFTSPLCTLVIEIPFIILFVIVIAMLAGNLALIPLAMILLFSLMGFVSYSLISKKASRRSRTQSKCQAFLIESLHNQRAIKYSGIENIWLERHKDLAAKDNMAGFKANLVSIVISNIANFLMMFAGVLVIAFGAVKVMNGTMSAGALIAVMMLIWRILSPLKQLFISSTHLIQVLNSVNQINLLMKLDAESKDAIVKRKFSFDRNDIVFYRVSLSYQRNLDPALIGVNFKLNEGELGMVIGKNGTGKSSILKVLLQLYMPQSGSVQIGGMDIRQIDCKQFRSLIGYVPQIPQFFYGTISQNLRLAHPLATEKDIEEACKLAGVYDLIMKMEDKFETRIGDQKKLSLPVAFQQQLSLARAYIKKPKILLLDEPLGGLDKKAEDKFWRVIRNIKGTVTVLMITHRLEHLKKADRIFHIHNGMISEKASSEEALTHIKKEFEYNV